MYRHNPSRPSLPALCAALALAAPIACQDGPDAVDTLADDVSEDLTPGDSIAPRDLAPDPALAAEYGWCPYNTSFAGVPVHLRYPTATNCNTSVEGSPLVLVLRGYDFGYDTYDYLLEHLAANGFIAVSPDIMASPDNLAGHQAAAEQAEAVLADMLASWPKANFIDPTRLAIVGHSRGGQTMRHLADRLKGGADPWTVRALVGLASKAGELPVDGDETVGLLLLQPSTDTDQTPDRAYALYDGAGTESSIVPAHPNAVYKAMKLLVGGMHHAFSTDLWPEGNQTEVTKGYVLAFLAAHLLGDVTWYEDYIRGHAIPGGWPTDVITQVSDGFLRTVIDNFEDGLVTGVPIGGGVGVTLGLSASVVDLATEPGAQHDTHALRLSGGASGDAFTWTFSHGFDASAYKWLSLRIGQTTDTPTTGLQIQLRNNGVWSTRVTISAHGPIPTPLGMCPPLPYACPPAVVYDHMGTVRIALTAFGAHDDVDGVRILFRGDSVDHEFLIDNLEFAEWLYKP